MTLSTEEERFYEIKTRCIIGKVGCNAIEEVDAVWDTGCTHTHIAQRIADKLGLEPEGVGKSYSADSIGYDNLYHLDIMLPNRQVIHNMEVYASALPGDEMLIGLDIICMGDFAISRKRDGGCMFSFRIPSRSERDFVKKK